MDHTNAGIKYLHSRRYPLARRRRGVTNADCGRMVSDLGFADDLEQVTCPKCLQSDAYVLKRAQAGAIS